MGPCEPVGPWAQIAQMHHVGRWVAAAAAAAAAAASDAAAIVCELHCFVSTQLTIPQRHIPNSTPSD